MGRRDAGVGDVGEVAPEPLYSWPVQANGCVWPGYGPNLIVAHQDVLAPPRIPQAYRGLAQLFFRIPSAHDNGRDDHHWSNFYQVPAEMIFCV